MISDLPRCAKFCAATGQEIAPGQTVFSVLLEEEGNYKRIDYSQEGWKNRANRHSSEWAGEPEGLIVGWWKHKLPVNNDKNDKKVKLAPNDILLALFDQLAGQPEKQDLRYVLTLLLIRRRVFRLEKEERGTDGEPWDKIVVYHPKTDTTCEIFVTVPEQERIEQVQDELAGLITNY